ncbi:MAG: DEAD/DEAH box helicase [Taibaiella sp.]|jgi:SWI/SNF-related matrix-associated actin-dependent regulator 1 of chromatin subfamily A
MIITDYGTYFHVTINFNRWFKVNVQAVKELDVYLHDYGNGVKVEEKMGKVKWIADKKVWYVSGELRNKVVVMAAKRKATIQPYEVSAPEKTGEIHSLPDLTIELPLNNITLRPYQKQGIARGLELEQFLNGDEQGLGKTIQSIATVGGWAQQGKPVFPCIIICPATLKENWKREIEKFTNYKAAILTDAIKNTWPQYYQAGMVQFFIVNYDSLKKYFVHKMPDPKKVKMSTQIEMKENISLFKTIIIDESQRCKDASTMRTKLVLRMAAGKQYRILLSGTPVMNKPIDLYSQLVIMGKIKEFGITRKGFSDRYCDGGKGASNLKEMNYLLNEHCFFRREKKDVAKDLPEKQRQQIFCEITTRSEYDFAENNFRQFLQRSGATNGMIDKALRAEALVKINELRGIAARGKIEEAREFIDEVMESQQKLIVFVHHGVLIDSLKEIYPHAVTIRGSDSLEQRQKNIDAFQDDPKCLLIVCSLKAANVGITLTASSREVFLEYPWTYADLVQAEDRAHRIGQKNAVMCSYLLGKNTIDEKMFQMILDKKEIANTITGGTDTMEMSVVDSVINLFSNKSLVA